MNRSAFWLSRRYRQGKKNHLVALISWFSTAGIALGVAVLIIGLSAMNGFEKELNQRILAVVPQVEITGFDEPVENYAQLQQAVKNDSDILASTPFVRFQGLLENGTKLSVALLRGVDPQSLDQVSRLSHFVEGQGWQAFKQDQAEGGLILGAGIAEKLGVKQGDWVTLLLPQKNDRQSIGETQQWRLPVCGILRLHGQLDYHYALLPLTQAQQFLGYNRQQATGIELKLKAPFDAQQLRYSSLQNYPQGLQANSWISQFGYMYNDIRLIRTVMYLAMVLVIGVACFNIISTLIMTVKDKQGDIAILQTLGASPAFIKKIFIYYGVQAGLNGALIGTILGIFITLNLTAIVRTLETLIGHKFLSSGIYFIDFLPTKLEWTDVLIVCSATVILSLIASLYPASRAAQLAPSAVLSGKG